MLITPGFLFKEANLFKVKMSIGFIHGLPLFQIAAEAGKEYTKAHPYIGIASTALALLNVSILAILSEKGNFMHLQKVSANLSLCSPPQFATSITS